MKKFIIAATMALSSTTFAAGDWSHGPGAAYTLLDEQRGMNVAICARGEDGIIPMRFFDSTMPANTYGSMFNLKLRIDEGEVYDVTVMRDIQIGTGIPIFEVGIDDSFMAEMMAGSVLKTLWNDQAYEGYSLMGFTAEVNATANEYCPEKITHAASEPNQNINYEWY